MYTPFITVYLIRVVSHNKEFDLITAKIFHYTETFRNFFLYK